MESNFKSPESMLLSPKVKDERKRLVLEKHRNIQHASSIKKLLSEKLEKLQEEPPRRKPKTPRF